MQVPETVHQYCRTALLLSQCPSTNWWRLPDTPLAERKPMMPTPATIITSPGLLFFEARVVGRDALGMLEGVLEAIILALFESFAI